MKFLSMLGSLLTGALLCTSAPAQFIAVTSPPPSSQTALPSVEVTGLVIGTPGPAPFSDVQIRTRYPDGTMCPAFLSDGSVDQSPGALGWNYAIVWDASAGIGTFEGRASFLDPGTNYIDIYFPGSTLGIPDQSISVVFQPAGLQSMDSIAIVHPLQRTVDRTNVAGNSGAIEFQMDVLNNIMTPTSATITAKVTTPSGAIVNLPMGGAGVDAVSYTIPPGDFSFTSSIDPVGMTFSFPLDQVPFPQPVQLGKYHMELFLHDGPALVFFDEDIDFWIVDRVGKPYRDISGQHDLGKLVLHGSGSVGSGLCAFDYDNDGLTDLFVTDPAGDRMRFEGTGIEIDYPGASNQLMHNNGDGTFTNVTAIAGVGGNPAIRSYGASWGDLDGDGDNDLVVANRKAHFTIFRNNGDGTFFETPQPSLPDDGSVWGQVIRLGDLDNDGDLDIFVGTYVQQWNFTYQHVGFRNRVLLNGAKQGKFEVWDPTFPTFEDFSAPSGANSPWQTLAAFFIDSNRDGNLDLAVHQDFGPFSSPNSLLEGHGDGTFTDVGAATGYSVQEFSMGAASADFNADGYLDVYSTSIGLNSLLMGGPGGTYTQAIHGSGAEGDFMAFGPDANGVNMDDTWGVQTFDYDFDMDVDMHVIGSDLFVNYQFPIATLVPDSVFENDGTGHFVDRAIDLGLGNGGRGRSSVQIDVDNDGDLDIVTSNDSEGLTVSRNDIVQTNHYLGVRPVTRRSAPGGFNTFFRVDVNPGSSPVQVYELMADSPHSGMQDNLRRFGLGGSTKAFETTAEWTSGGSSTWYNLAGDQDHLLYETVIEVQGQIDGSVAEGSTPSLIMYGRPGDLVIGVLGDAGVPFPFPLPTGGELDLWPNFSFLKLAFVGPTGTSPWAVGPIPIGLVGAIFELQMVSLNPVSGIFESKSGVSTLTVTL